MAEAEDESRNSSLQRKKPPWLRLDIPIAPNPVDEHNNFLQVDIIIWCYTFPQDMLIDLK